MTAADAWQALMPVAVGVVQATAELCPDVPPLFGSRLVNGRFVLHGDLLFTAVAMAASATPTS